MDFTLSKYGALLDTLKAYGFEFLVLRHDVDLLPGNSLRTARLEAEKRMSGIYYFRAVPESWDEGIIREIAALGHEIGYHSGMWTPPMPIFARIWRRCGNLSR